MNKKILITILVILASFFQSKAQVTINEILADPGNYDGQGGEWTELHNAGASPVDVSCWVLTDGEEIIVMPSGTMVPAGGYLMVMNSNFFNSATANWTGWVAAANTTVVNLATCGCTNQSATGCYAVTWDNPSLGTGTDRVVLFDATANIIDAVYWGVGDSYAPANAPILETIYATGTNTSGHQITGGAAGCTLPASNNYDIPAITGNPIWENLGPSVTGCTSSFARSSDGSSTWIVDNWPSPGVTNTAVDYIVTVTNVTDATTVYSYSVTNGVQTPTSVNKTVSICSGKVFQVQVAANNYNMVFNDIDGDAGLLVPNGSNVDITGGVIITDAPYTETNANGVSTLTYNTPVISSNVVINFNAKENTQGATANPNVACATAGSTIVGQGNAAECFIQDMFTIEQINPITSITYTCTNGFVTVNTVPASNFGSYTLNLTNSTTPSLNNSFVISSTPYSFQLTQGNAADYSLAGGVQTPNCAVLPAVTGGPICVFAPACPTFADNTTCPANVGPYCPGSSISFGLNAITSTNLPNGGVIQWVNDTDNDGDVYDEGVAAIIGTQNVIVTPGTGTPAETATTCGDINNGAIAFTTFAGNSATETFSFITLENLTAGMVINFTDNAWTSAAGPFSSNEGFIAWTVPTGGVAAGTTVSFTGPSWGSPNVGGSSVVSGSVAFVNAGDNLFAFCGTSTAPTFISGITSSNYITTGASSTSLSYLPSSLAVGSSAIDLANGVNSYFNCTGGTLTGTTAPATIFNVANWTTNGTAVTPPIGCSVTFGTPSTTSLSPTCLSYSIPTSACNTTLNIKPRISPDQTGCTPGSPIPTLPTETFVVVCPSASITGESAICSGASTTMPVTITNAPASCTNVQISYSINGGAAITSAVLPITAGIATVPGLTTAGTYVLTNAVFSGGGCTACTATLTGTMVVTVAANPAAPTASSQAVCNGQPSTITAIGDPALTWYSDIALTTIIGSGNSMNLTATVPTTVYVQSINIDNGCKSQATPVSITINALPVVTANPIRICTGTTLNLDGAVTGGTTPYAYFWTKSVGSYTSNIEDPNVTATATTTNGGVYNLLVQDANNCYSSDTATIAIDQAPVADTGSSFTTICESNTTAISLGGAIAGGATTGTWTVSPSGAGTIANASNLATASFTNTVGFNGTATFTLTTDANGVCAADAKSKSLIINATPTVTAATCASNTVTVTASCPACSSIEYSLDNINWQATNIFTPASAGASGWGGAGNITAYARNAAATTCVAELTLAANPCLFPLPLTLISFTGEAKGDYNLLVWKTTQEKNIKMFEVEKSVNGLQFSKIGAVNALNNNAVNTYTLNDNHVVKDNYYRLNIIDEDGQSNYSPIVYLSNGIYNNITISPNPFNDNIKIEFENNNKNVVIEVFDMAGRKILSKKVLNNTQKYFTVLDCKQLVKGNYIIQVTQGNTNFKRLITKE
jgi:hypothetical protein